MLRHRFNARKTFPYKVYPPESRALAAVVKNSNGWLVDWLEQETSGLVAGARNRAVALGRDELAPKDFTVVWTETASSTIDDSDSFTTTDTNKGVRAVGITSLTRTYTARIKGTTTAAAIQLLDHGASVVLQSIAVAGGAFDKTFTFTRTGTSQSGVTIRSTTAGTTDIDWAISYIQQTDIAASSQGLGLLDGTHIGVQVGAPGNGRGIRYAARYDGATTYTDISSAELNSMLNPARGTLTAWARVSGAGVWTDGTQRFLARLFADSSNNIAIRKSSTNNQILMDYDAGGTSKQIAISVSLLNLFMLTLTWDVNAGATGEVKGYLNAVQQDVTKTNLGVWVNNLDPTATTIGAGTTTPSSVWDGDIAYVSLYDQVLTQAEITRQWNAGN